MKKMILLTIALVFVVAGVASAGTVVDSAHDMRTYFTGTGSTATSQVCVYCHTPHMPAGRTQDPLWNHSLSTNGSYLVYTSSTMNAAPTAMTGSDGSVGSLCMSCHDGTVAVNSLWKQPVDLPVGSTRSGIGNNILSATNQIASTASGYIGTDLSNDHPVNFTYDNNLILQDTTLKAPSSTGLPLFGNSSVQCATCHNVHDPANKPFLRKANTNSGLCLSCHSK